MEEVKFKWGSIRGNLVSLIKISFIFVFFFFGYRAKAQEAFPQFDLNLTVAIPINEQAISDSSTSTSIDAIGIGGGFTLPIKSSPIRLGLSFRYLWIGSRTKDFYFTDNQGFEYLLISTVKGSMSPLHFEARIDPMIYTNFPVMPYVGGFMGIRFFGSNHKITIDYEDGTEPSMENNRKVSVTSSYGFELGLHIRINKWLLLDFRYEHAYGGWAKYVDLSTVEIDNNGDASYERIETRTDAAMFTVGVAMLIKE